MTLHVSHIDTPLGAMAAVGDDEALYLLQFTDSCSLDKEMQSLKKHYTLCTDATKPSAVVKIEKELKEYFSGQIHPFKTPLRILGSPFQNRVWHELRKIPCGATRSYSDISRATGKPPAFRAVARACSLNPLAIIVPCHRVISSSGSLGGYNAGAHRKQWLLHHEKER